MIKTISFANLDGLNKQKKVNLDSDPEPTDFAAVFGMPLFDVPAPLPGKNVSNLDLTPSTPFVNEQSDLSANILEPNFQTTILSATNTVSTDGSSLIPSEPNPSLSTIEIPAAKPLTDTSTDILTSAKGQTSANHNLASLNKNGTDNLMSQFPGAQNTFVEPKWEKSDIKLVHAETNDVSKSSMGVQTKNLKEDPINIGVRPDLRTLPPEINSGLVSVAALQTTDGENLLKFRPARFDAIISAGGNSPLFGEVSKIIKADDSLKIRKESKHSIPPDLIRESSETEVLDLVSEPEKVDFQVLVHPDPIDIDDRPDETPVFSIQNSNSRTERSDMPMPAGRGLPPPVLEQLEPRILELAAATRLGNGKRTVKLRLNPQNLGSVEVTLEKNSTGRIDAHFRTETRDAHQILGESLTNLRHSLENAGWSVGELEISYNSSSSSGNQQREAPLQRFGNTEKHAAETIVPDGHLATEGENKDRLVNLRA